MPYKDSLLILKSRKIAEIHIVGWIECLDGKPGEIYSNNRPWQDLFRDELCFQTVEHNVTL
jgi:hypothetical protein